MRKPAFGATAAPKTLPTRVPTVSAPAGCGTGTCSGASNWGGIKPNAGHIALAEFQQRHPERLTLMTQNVDQLHQAAGSTDVLELHGNWRDGRWLDPCPKTLACSTTRAEPGHPPRCPECGHLLRYPSAQVLPALLDGL